jgi:N utilization substance protein B
MQIVYAFKAAGPYNLKDSKQFLFKSIQAMYDLYLSLLSLMIEVNFKAKDYLKKSQKKHLATHEDINPNWKFVNNNVLNLLVTDNNLKAEFEKHKIKPWELDSEYVDIIFKNLIASDIYKEYMSTQESSFEEDKRFLVEFYKTIIAPNEKLHEYFEDKTITWIDDLPVVNTVIVKMLRKVKPNNDQRFFTPNIYKDVEDKQFASNLLQQTLLNADAYEKEVEAKTQNWDKDRIANIDFVLLKMAICEFLKFPSIPTKVTINEYLDIAKEYSTPKSNVFINGILDKLVKEYEAKGTLKKSARGLQ